MPSEVLIDFDEPRYGPVCVHAVAGDTLKFQWDEWHNLHELPDYDAYEGCDFEDAVVLAGAAPNAGVYVDATQPGDLYFSCSKICASHGHKVHVCVAPDTNSTCECDEPVPTPRPTGPTLRPSYSPAPSISPSPTSTRVTIAQASSGQREANPPFLLAAVLVYMARRFIARC